MPYARESHLASTLESLHCCPVGRDAPDLRAVPTSSTRGSTMFWLSRPHDLAENLTSRLEREDVFGQRRPVKGDWSGARPCFCRNWKIASFPRCWASSSFPRTIPGTRTSAMLRWRRTRRRSSPISARRSRLHPDWGADSPANGDDPLYGIPVNIVHGNSTAKVNVIIDNYPGESDIVPVPIPANAVIEGDYQDGPNPNGGGYNPGQRGDSHLIIWDEDNNTAYELYGVTRPSDTDPVSKHRRRGTASYRRPVARGPGNRLEHEHRHLPHPRRNFGGRGRPLDPGRPGPSRRGAAGFPGRPGRDRPRAALHPAERRRQPPVHLPGLAHRQ